MEPSVYIETSVVSYLTTRLSRNLVTAAHQEQTHDWWSSERSRFRVLVSELVIQEISAGDPVAAKERLALLEGISLLATVPDALHLASVLVEAGAIPALAATDAPHTAIAAADGVHYLLTWNCRHIANAQARSRIESTCRSQGYLAPIFFRPEELMGK